MKLFIYLLIVTNGFSVVLAYDDKCEVNDLNALMVRLRQLKTDFHNLKLEYDKHINESKEEINNLKEANEKQMTIMLEYDKKINASKEEINNLKKVNEKQATEMLEYKTQINASKEEINNLKKVHEKQATEILESITQINASKEEINHLTEVNGKLEKEMLELKAEISNKSTEIAEQSREIEGIKGLFSTRVPAFVVRQKEVHYNCVSKIPFEIILLNVGNVYSNITNHFKAPQKGLYMLTAQLCSHVNSAFDFSISSYTYKKQYGASRNGKTSDHDCRSLTTLSRLTENEEVYVHVVCPGTGQIEGHIGDNFWTMFTGTLLAPEL